ncbi:MAG: isoamylase early set domain-containing protein [Thiovulaceae bacterium]|nr:isoamylase early set domain-containing protein [Sulfurimonadaceae bacterium]
MVTMKKNGGRVWVTFTFAPVEGVKEVAVSGEWNGWKDEPMKQKKSGDFSITKVLKAGNIFQFGYKVNGSDWIAEDECPRVLSPFLSQNSLLAL